MRCIWYTNPSGKEGVYFTEEDDVDASEVIPTDCKVEGDFDPEMDGFPSNFPFDTILEKKM
jgi:hypothetical protein